MNWSFQNGILKISDVGPSTTEILIAIFSIRNPPSLKPLEGF